MSATLNYNTRGDLLGWNAWTYAHDAWGHIIEASKPPTGETIRYHYDALGQRAGKYAGTAAPTWYLHYEDDLILATASDALELFDIDWGCVLHAG